MKKIYMVTTLCVVDDFIKHNRTHGWYEKRTDAIKCVKKNLGDIYENGYYNCALVEGVGEGLYNISGTLEEEDWFFVYPLQDKDGAIESYHIVKTDKPDCFTGVINFSIG